MTSVRHWIDQAVRCLPSVQIEVGIEDGSDRTRTRRIDDLRRQLTRSIPSRGNSVYRKAVRNDCCWNEVSGCVRYPNANVTHSTSLRQRLRHLSSTFVSVFLKVLSNGSIAPRAMRSKQSARKKRTIKRDERSTTQNTFPLLFLSQPIKQPSDMKSLSRLHHRNQLLMLIHLRLLAM